MVAKCYPEELAKPLTDNSIGPIILILFFKLNFDSVNSNFNLSSLTKSKSNGIEWAKREEEYEWIIG